MRDPAGGTTDWPHVAPPTALVQRALPDAFVAFESLASAADVAAWLSTRRYVVRLRCAHSPTPLDARQRGALLLLARADVALDVPDDPNQC